MHEVIENSKVVSGAGVCAAARNIDPYTIDVGRGLIDAPIDRKPIDDNVACARKTDSVHVIVLIVRRIFDDGGMEKGGAEDKVTGGGI
jgi:hypothetical protein